MMNGPLDTDPRKLISDYVALCNRAMWRNMDKPWFRRAKRLGERAVGGANFRVLVFRDDPDDIVAEATLHFDADEQALRVLPPGQYDVAFTWKVSTSYLGDVVNNRPQWYLDNPLMLDWNWLTDRVGHEVARHETRSLAAGFVLGAVVTLAVLAVWPASGRGGRG